MTARPITVELDHDEAHAALLAIDRNPSWHDAMDRAADKIRAAIAGHQLTPPEPRGPDRVGRVDFCEACDERKPGRFVCWTCRPYDVRTEGRKTER
jgi:hypothetical protein